MTRYQLAHRFVRLHRDVYIAPGIEPTPLLRAKAAWLWVGERGVLVGTSAAVVHGTRWLPPSPAEIVRNGHLRAVPGITVRGVTSIETCVVDGFVVSTPARTGFDPCAIPERISHRTPVSTEGHTRGKLHGQQHSHGRRISWLRA